MLGKTTDTMKCDNSLPVFGDSTLSPGLRHDASLNNRDMQYIFNKKRRFNHPPNRIGRSSPPLRIQSTASVDCPGDSPDDNNEEEDGEELDSNEQCLRMDLKMNAQKSKLLLPTHLYKSFLANAFRTQKSSPVAKSEDCPSDFPPLNSSAINHLNSGLHIFPRNLLFSCSADRKSPPSNNSRTKLKSASPTTSEVDIAPKNYQ